MSVAVISKSGIRLMPTSEYRARHLLKLGKAVIEQYRPIFTIRLTEREDGDIQLIEYASDTGYQHVGVSIKSEKHEFVHAQYDMLSNKFATVLEYTIRHQRPWQEACRIRKGTTISLDTKVKRLSIHMACH